MFKLLSNTKDGEGDTKATKAVKEASAAQPVGGEKKVTPKGLLSSIQFIFWKDNACWEY